MIIFYIIREKRFTNDLAATFATFGVLGGVDGESGCVKGLLKNKNSYREILLEKRWVAFLD